MSDWWAGVSEADKEALKELAAAEKDRQSQAIRYVWKLQKLRRQIKELDQTLTELENATSDGTNPRPIIQRTLGRVREGFKWATHYVDDIAFVDVEDMDFIDELASHNVGLQHTE